MNHQDFNSALAQTLGYGYMRKFTGLTGLSPSQISRYANGHSVIPAYIELIVNMLPVVMAANRTDVIPRWAEIMSGSAHTPASVPDNND